MATTTNFGWETPDDTDLVKDGAAAIRTLGSAIDTSLVDLKGGTTGQVLSKNSNTDMDFTWVTSDDANAIQNAIVDAKGDLIAATAADTPARLASSGVNGDVLTVDTTTATGLKWSAPAASSPLTTKGDLYTYSTTNARLAVGNNGETVFADSFTSTGLRYNPPVGSLANPIINGGFDIWQRGTSGFVPGNNSTTFAADRWLIQRGTTGSTVSRQTISDSTNLPNIQYALRVARDSGNTSTSTIGLATNVETTNSIPFANRTVTLSFYARAGANYSAASSALNAELRTGTGTDENTFSTYTGSATPISSNVTLTTTWQRFALTGTLAATTTEFALKFVFTPVGTAGANDWYEISGVQVDVGTWSASTAPAFRRSGNTLAGELAACQRYYVRKTADSSALYATFGTSIATSTTGHWWQVPLPVQMRVTPTSMDYSTTRIQNINNAYPETGGLTLSASNSHNLIATGSGSVASGLTTGNFYWLGANNSSTAYIGFSAEL